MPQYPSRARSLLGLASAIAAFSTVVPAGLAAQDEDSGPVRVFAFNRPRIGVRVDVRPNSETDKLGARIAAVTEDGPAAKAGLKEGDIITRFNGVGLAGLKSDDEDESGPGAKLISLAQKLDPGDTVDVEYRRGNENKKTKIVAAELSNFGMGRWRLDGPDMRGMIPKIEGMPRYFEGGPGEFRFFTDRLYGGLELTDLNPDLGEYFGAKEGVLVLRTPEDSTMPLKAGDVIVSIDGRAPRSEAQAHRILRSYEPGETAKIEVVRKQKRMTLNWVPRAPEERWKAPKTRRPAVERS
jgi:S1-C subfamily serine protease